MALGRTLIDRAGAAHAMAGLLPVATSFAEPRLQLGYRRLSCSRRPRSAPPARPSAATSSTTRAWSRAARRRRCSRSPTPAAGALGSAGARAGTVAGSFLHLIDRSTEPGDTFSGPRHLRVVES